ncbi:hypothetical protein SISNIDRAFT_449121 [Sistotremastrum niveocremeum HHB9708]|uniref:Uncharacterized protein n=1 Tax=Sistotremastrum niveocremeum HHB9708 TaxID=1314777 RepID=A0A164Z665_9AGAM|nr:hypothetical protein SISNIDRAFT_449121 [Sistotremastrum niveocremeum HHB9708]
MALAASYSALNRYLHGQDLYLLPRNVQELEAILCVRSLMPPALTRDTDVSLALSHSSSYSTDAIHNLISQSRVPLQPGGYSRVSSLLPHPMLARC